MILEITAAVISLTAAGSAGVLCHGAKRYFEKSVAAFRLSALMANKSEHSKSKAAGHASDAELHAGRACEHANLSFDSQIKTTGISKSIAELAEKHTDITGHYLTEARAAVDQADSFARQAAAHADTAENHSLTAGTLSVAVTKAAQRAAEKSQVQAECYSCQRPVNQYTLKHDGRVVCKWCSDRGK
jgi:hypothetical protein